MQTHTHRLAHTDLQYHNPLQKTSWLREISFSIDVQKDAPNFNYYHPIPFDETLWHFDQQLNE